MNEMFTTLPEATWLDEQATQEPDAEFKASEQAIAAKKELCKQKEAEIMDLASSMKISTSEIEKENQALSQFAENLAEQDEQAHASLTEVDDVDLIRQVAVSQAIGMETVAGGGAGRYFDSNPYHGWGRVDRHNEDGVTVGAYSWNLRARKMFPWAHARGDGSGITDDNDVTTWTKLFFAFWPRQNGHVRAFAPYVTRGTYRIFSDDKWYNSKEAKVHLEMHLRVGQNWWTDYVKDQVYYRFDDNINDKGRIDRSGSLYSPSLDIGAGKWVLAEVVVWAHVETEGGGSTATLNFSDPSYIHIPYVRFDFA